MQIVTEEFSYTPAESFRLLFRQWLRSRWKMIVLLLVAGAVGANAARDPWGGMRSLQITLAILVVLFLIAYPFANALNIWMFCQSPLNRNMFKPRRFVFEDDFLHATLQDGSLDKVRYENIVKVKRLGDNFQLFLGLSLYFLIPDRAFKSKDDLEQFEAHLRAKGLI